MSVDFLLAADAAIVLDYKGANQAVVKGINSMPLPGMSRETITVDEFRNDFARKFAGGGQYSDLSFAGNFVLGDTLGQDKLKQHFINRTKLTGTDLVCFIDYAHFFTTDIANDASSFIQVSGIDASPAGKNDTFALSGTLLPGGRLAIYAGHCYDSDEHIGSIESKYLMDPTDLTFVDGVASNDTITRASGSFVDAGFVAGQTLLIIGSTSNDEVATTIKTVEALTLTLNSAGELTDEEGVAGTELHGGSI
jgi:hypothetical protein